MTIEKPRFPSFFDWQPVPAVGAFQFIKAGQRRKNDNPDEIYGTISSKIQSVEYSRGKFFLMIWGHPFIAALRIPYRLVSLLGGDFIRPGMQNGRYEWLLKRQKGFFDGKEVSQLPGARDLQIAIAKGIAIEFVKNAGKTALYAVMVIPLWVTAVCGFLFNPYDADVVFGAIENLTARNWIPLSGRKKFWQLQIGDYLAPCKQTNGVIDRKDLHRIWANYHSGTLRSLIGSLYVELQAKKDFFSRELGGVKSICDSLRKYKDSLEIVGSPNDQSELREDGSLGHTAKPRCAKVAELLNQLKTTLAGIEKIRAEVTTRNGIERVISQRKTQLTKTIADLNRIFQIS